ncbi:MAG: GNAT family N-acetyltransferase [Butyrivibrio sp.]|nr:GNAT family N-acetyltransferase [Butyrivibrio sp.]
MQILKSQSLKLRPSLGCTLLQERGKMIKLAGLSDSEVEVISRQIADAFYDYEYNKEDQGLIKFIPNRESMYTYIGGIIRAAYRSGILYTTSEKREGFLVLSGEGVGTVGFVDGMKMISAEKRALGGFKKMKEFISACFSNGHSIETRMKKAKKKFIKIEVLVVRKEFQRKGFMKKMLKYVYDMADKKGISVILDTDDKDKSERYRHLGMELDRVRNCGENFHMYDLVREPEIA